MERISIIIRTPLLGGVVMLAHLAAGGEAQEMLSRGKGIPMARCPEMTLERRAEKFFAPPRWEERNGPGGPRKPRHERLMPGPNNRLYA